jgi:hypothetical protein
MLLARGQAQTNTRASLPRQKRLCKHCAALREVEGGVLRALLRLCGTLCQSRRAKYAWLISTSHALFQGLRYLRG